MPHTADAKFRVTGDSLEQAFIGAAKALTKVMTDDVVKPVFKKLISVKAKTLEALLYDFLQELVFLLDVEGFLMSRVEFIFLITSKSGSISFNSMFSLSIVGFSIVMVIFELW